MIKVELTDQEFQDMQHALIVAMKEYDKSGDTGIADRLEGLKSKIEKARNESTDN